MLHSVNVFPLLEPGVCGGWDDDSSSSSLSVSPSIVIMPSGLQLGVNVSVTDDTLTRCGNSRFTEFICDPPITVLS